MNRLICIWAVLIFVTIGADGQAFTATWPLLNPPQLAGSGTGNVTVSDELVSPGTLFPLVIQGYNSFGQLVNTGTNGWPVAGVKYDRYLEFNISANAGEEIVLNQVDFEYGYDFSWGNLIGSEVWISPDHWANSQQLASTQYYPRDSMLSYSSTGPSTGASSATWSVRIFPFSNNPTGNKFPTFATHRNVVLSGTTQPVSPIGECLDAVPPDMVGWWTGDQNAQDISGTGNHGTFAGSYQSPGKVADAFTTGMGQTVSVPHHSSLDFGPNQGFAIDFWMRTDNPAGLYNILSKQDLSTLHGYRVYLANGLVVFDARTSALVTSTTTEPYPQDSDWHFVGIIVGASSPQSMSITIDGVTTVVDGATVPAGGTMANTSPLIIGGWSPNQDSNPFVGQIDEVEIFNRDLSTSELLAIYNAGAKGKCKPEVPTTGTIEGFKFNDADNDGIWDQDGTELGLPNVLIELVPLTAGAPGQSMLTGADGSYSFTTAAGTFTLQEQVPIGYTQTAPLGGTYTVTVPSAVPNSGLNFGNHLIDTTGTIEGFKFNDADNDGIWDQDGTELGLPNVLIELVPLTAGAPGQSMLTGADGSYSFTTAAGTFTLQEQVPVGYTQTAPLGGTYTVTVPSAVPNSGLNFGNHLIGRTGSICGWKFNDADGNGSWDQANGEAGMGGWTIMLSGLAAGVVTEPDGSYCFKDLEAGDYTVSEVAQDGWVQRFPAQPGTHQVTLDAGADVAGINFGNQEIMGMCFNMDPTGMYGWWPGEGNSNDVSGHGHDATFTGTYDQGMVGQAFRFNAPSDVAIVPASPAFDVPANQDFSLDLWFNTDYNDLQYLVSKYDILGNGHGFSLSLDGAGILSLSVAGPGLNTNISSGPGLNNGEWHFASVSVDRDLRTGFRLKVDGTPTVVLDPLQWQATSLNTPTSFQIGGSTQAGAKFHFRGLLDEIEYFNRAVPDDEFAAIYQAGAFGKCPLEPGDRSCDETVRSLDVSTGFDHPASTTYAVGGLDAFWSITRDPDLINTTTPRPATVTAPYVLWAGAQANSVWIAPAEVLPDPANPPHQYQAAVGVGYYDYTLEFCIVGEAAETLEFNLSVLSDNNARVYFIDTLGNSHPIGSAPANAFAGPPTPVGGSPIPGPWVAGTYHLVVEVYNDGMPSDFTGLNISGTITGGNLFMQKNECCNSDGHIAGTKYIDVDGDGEYEPEDVMGGVVITALNTVTGDTYSFTTDAQGNYYLDVPPGIYTVTETQPAGFTQSIPASGSYQITVGPGGMAANIDFVNTPIPCLTAAGKWLCDGQGRAYLQLTVTNNTIVPVYSVEIASLTSGVTAVLASTSPANPYPIAPDGQVLLNVYVTGLAPEDAVQIKIDMSGQPDMNGLSENCCTQTVSFELPGGFRCPFVIFGHVNFDGVIDDTSPTEWVVRASRAGDPPRTSMTDDMGAYSLQGLMAGEYTVSVDQQRGFRTTSPEIGAFMVDVDARNPEVMLDFTVAIDASHTATEEGGDAIPTEYGLDVNYPNPFNPRTQISYQLPEGSKVQIVVYDMLGRVVETLVDRAQPAGTFTVSFDAGDLPSGLYLYRMTAGSFVHSRKMILMK